MPDIFDLEAFRKERHEQRAKGFRQWKPVASSLIAAYKEGERDFERAHLEGANLEGANLERANLEGANLYGANLYGANLYGANLERAHLYGANLERAHLYGANLYGANLYGAHLEGAHPIKAIYGVGDNNRLVYAYIHDGQIRIQAGCRNGTPAAIRKAVKEDYAKDSGGYADYMDTILYLEKWGKRVLKQRESEKPKFGTAAVEIANSEEVTA